MPAYPPHFGTKRLTRRAFALSLIAVWLGAASARAQPPVARDYELKAVFLFRFTAFVEWPPSAFPDRTSPFVIGVLGTDPFGKSLDEVIRDERVRDRAVLVERFQNWETVPACHILFISRSEAGHLPQILRRLRGHPVLSVSDLDRFALHGGIMELDTTSGRVQLTVNVEAARAAGLTLSSKLLRLSQRVET